MSEYVDYIKEFPCRIIETYDKSFNPTKSIGREVTLLLSLTASGIAVPLDRLRPDDNERLYPDPFEDRKEFDKAAEKFDDIFKSVFRKSDLWPSHALYVCGV